MSSLPTPLRAVLGLALTVVDSARDNAAHLPQRAAGLPVAVVSQAVQLSLRAQQQYAAYVNKGDELIGTFRGAPEEAPAWATFDEDEPTPARNTAFDRVPDAEEELDQLQAIDELEELSAVLAGDEAGIDAAADILLGDYEAADRPRPTPGAPDTVSPEGEVEITSAGDEVFGADAPRPTASREPRKATRKIATKASRKSGAKKASPAKKVAAPVLDAPSPPPPAKKTARKAAKKAAKKAPGRKVADTTLEGAPLHEETLVPEDLALPASPDSQVSDTQPDDEAGI